MLWRLKWDNSFKEVYWRLVLNGLATAERMHMTACACVCGPVDGGQPGRRHHFWGCPVAKAVVGELQRHLVGWFPGLLQPQHVLFMVCPQALGVGGARALHKGVWRVVCLAAVNAMDMGRRAAYKLRVDERQQQEAAAAAAAQQSATVPTGQQLITAFMQPAPLTAHQQQHRAQVQQRQQAVVQQQRQQQQQDAAARLAALKQQAVDRFWELLQDFVVVGAAPPAWRDKVPAQHPFLHVVDERFCVHRLVAAPDAGAAPP
jgi:hypothetical protein